MLAALWWATLSQSGITCEVCMQYEGRVHCSRVAAPSREEAEVAALQSACGTLAGGVTSGLGCQRTPPLSVDCGERAATIPD